MDRLYYTVATIPAGTPISAPVSQAWPLEDNQLVDVTIEVPDGHCGLTGVRILWAQQQIVPFANDSYLVANDRVLNYPFDDYITSSGLVIEGYNNDIFPHSFYVTALITNLPEPGENPEAEVVQAPEGATVDLSEPDDLNINTILNSAPSPPTVGPPLQLPPLPVGPPLQLPPLSPYQKLVLAGKGKRKAGEAVK